MPAPGDTEFPALTALTESVARAMHEAEAQEQASRPRAWSRRQLPWKRSRRGTGLALLALIAVVPTAAAVRSFLATEVPISVVLPPPSGDVTVSTAQGSAYVVAEGAFESESWTIAVRPCTTGASTGLAALSFIGDTPRSGGFSFGACPAVDDQRPGQLQNPPPATSRSRGLTLVYGLVPADGATVDLALLPFESENGKRIPGAPRQERIKTLPLPAQAIIDGNLPDRYRLLALPPSATDLQIQNATVRDATGAAILECTTSSCARP